MRITRTVVVALAVVLGATVLVACVPVPPPPGTPAGAGCGKPATPGLVQPKQLASGGVVRTYLLSIPTNYDPQVPTPLLLDFHGHGSNATEQSLYSQLDAKGTARGFIVATPDGIANQFDYTAPSVDFTYVNDLVRYLDSTLCIDGHRKFTTGMSNGAALSAALVCEPEIGLRAFASVAALLPACADGTKIPMMEFHGTADPIVSYAIAEPFTTTWATRDGCDPTPVDTQIGTDIRERTYTGCEPGLSVTLYTVEGGGHTWPDGLVDLPQFGATTRTIDASDLILDFFQSQ